MLLSFVIQKGTGFKFFSHRCRKRRFGSNLQTAGIPSPKESGHDDNLFWLPGTDGKNSYRLGYRHVPASNDTEPIAILFCNGFRSAMTGGTKAIALEDHCSKRGWEFCSFDYRGHGMSTGVFEDFTMSDWVRDASDILNGVLLPSGKHEKKKKRVVVVGSSMGAWISIHLALQFNTRTFKINGNKQRNLPIGGILGIAAAPDFLQDLYSSSTAQERAEWEKSGLIHRSSRYGDPYPISYGLIKDAAQNWGILPSTKAITSFESSAPAPTVEKHLFVGCPVQLLHGKRDKDVSWKKSEELARLLEGSENTALENRLTLIDDGDHRLSRPQDIKLILDTLDNMVTNLSR